MLEEHGVPARLLFAPASSQEQGTEGKGDGGTGNEEEGMVDQLEDPLALKMLPSGTVGQPRRSHCFSPKIPLGSTSPRVRGSQGKAPSRLTLLSKFETPADKLQVLGCVLVLVVVTVFGKGGAFPYDGATLSSPKLTNVSLCVWRWGFLHWRLLFLTCTSIPPCVCNDVFFFSVLEAARSRFQFAGILQGHQQSTCSECICRLFFFCHPHFSIDTGTAVGVMPPP